MGVYVIRNQPNYLRAGLFGQAFNVLGDQIGGMIKRSQDAAATEKYRKGWRETVDAMTPKPGAEVPAWEPVEDGAFGPAINKYFNDNAVSKDISANVWNTTPGLGKSTGGTMLDFAGAMGRAGTPELYKDAYGLFGKYFENLEKARHADEISSRFESKGGYDRGNESQSLANVAYLDLAGATPGNYIGNVAPNMQGQVVDAGDKHVPMIFNPGTGTWTQGTEMTKGVDTTQKYVADSNVKVAQTNARNSANKSDFTLVQGADGELYSYDKKTGLTYKDGQLVQGVKVPQTDSNVKNALAYLAWAQKMYEFTDMPPEVLEQVKQAQAIVAGSFAGSGQNPSPAPQEDNVPVPPTAGNSAPPTPYTYPQNGGAGRPGVFGGFSPVPQHGGAGMVQVPPDLAAAGLTPKQLSEYMRVKGITDPNEAFALLRQ